MSKARTKITVYETMNRILDQLNSPQEQRNLSSILAKIRNSIGRDLEDSADIWPFIFPMIPPQYLGCGYLSYEEKALIATLQLYAIGQQGSNRISNDESCSLGTALNNTREVDSTALDKRFNKMLTAATFEELVYYLRQIFKPPIVK